MEADALPNGVISVKLNIRQLAAQAKAFESEGGFTERLHRVRSERRSSPSNPSKKSTSSTKG